MGKLEHLDQTIIYDLYPPKDPKRPYILYLHGLCSGRHGTKATYLAEYCQQHDYGFISFDNYAHGDSSGTLVEATLGMWLAMSEEIITQLCPNNPLLIVGSSMGGWLSLLLAQKKLKNLKAIVTLAAAADFTEFLFRKRLSSEQRETLVQQKRLQVAYADMRYEIGYALVTEAKKHLLFTQPGSLHLPCAVRLLHGMQDAIVPYQNSLRIAEKIEQVDLRLHLFKQAGHRLNEPEILSLIGQNISEILG